MNIIIRGRAPVFGEKFKIYDRSGMGFDNRVRVFNEDGMIVGIATKYTVMTINDWNIYDFRISATGIRAELEAVQMDAKYENQ